MGSGTGFAAGAAAVVAGAAILKSLPDRIGTCKIPPPTRHRALGEQRLDLGRIISQLDLRNDVEDTIDPGEGATRHLQSGDIAPTAIELGIRPTDEIEKRAHRQRCVEVVEQGVRGFTLQNFGRGREFRRATTRRCEPIGKVTHPAHALHGRFERLRRKVQLLPVMS